MKPAPYPPDASTSRDAIALLSWRSFALALAVTLAIFFLLHPLWRDLDADAMDRNIFWSYVPIPALAAGLLAWERKLRWASFLLESLRLTLVKFAITFLFANVMWLWVDVPTRGPERPTPGGATTPGQAQPRAAPLPTPIDPAATGRLLGQVVDAAGAPRAGVAVAVTGGLQAFDFAPREEPVLLEHLDEGFRPRAVLVQAFERVLLRSLSGELHTAAALDERERWMFNVPLLAGAERELVFDRAEGCVTLHCTVHDRMEHVARLIVVGSPFGAWTDDEGRFAWEGVPAGTLEVSAWGTGGRITQSGIALAPGGAQDVRLTVD